jgi:hypothetical protein
VEQRETTLRLLLRRRHWQPHRTFTAEYDKAAAGIDRRLVGHGPSRVQLHRWQSGQLTGLPYPDHCRVLEAMFPGWSVTELFTPATEEEIARREGTPSNQPPATVTDSGVDDRFCDVTAVYATRGDFMSDVPPQVLFDRAARIRAAGLSLNLLCQHYPEQSLVRLIEEGAELTCLFLDPYGEAIKAREREEGYSAGAFSVLTELNIQLLQRIRDKLDEDKRGGLMIATYDETIRTNLLFVDGRCVAQPYLNGARGVDSPTFVIERRWPDRGLYSTYEGEFASLWGRSRPL